MRQRSNLIILFGIAFLLVGGAIVWLIVSDDDDAVASGTSSDRVSVLVAREKIPANTVGTDAIEQGLLETKEVDAGSQPAGALASAEALENRIFAVDVSKGATISNTQLATRSLSNIKVPEGFDGVAVNVAKINGGGGYIAPGDRVNVYGVFGDAAAVDGGLLTDGSPVPRTELALTNVTVLAVSGQQQTSVQAAAGTGDDAATQAAPASNLTYFLALTPADVERLVHLTTFADIYLSLTAEDAPNAGDTPGIDGTTTNAPVSAASAGRPAE